MTLDLQQEMEKEPSPSCETRKPESKETLITVVLQEGSGVNLERFLLLSQ